MLRKAAVNLLRKLSGESCYGRVLMRCCCRRLRAGRSQVFVLSCFLWFCLSRVFLCVGVSLCNVWRWSISGAFANPRDFLLVLFGMVLLFCDVFCLLLFSLWFCCVVELSAISCCPAMFSLWCFCTLAFSPSKRRDFVFSLSLSLSLFLSLSLSCTF